MVWPSQLRNPGTCWSGKTFDGDEGGKVLVVQSCLTSEVCGLKPALAPLVYGDSLVGTLLERATVPLLLTDLPDAGDTRIQFYTWVSSYPLEEVKRQSTPSILAWKILWIEEPAGHSLRGCRVRGSWSTHTHMRPTASSSVSWVIPGFPVGIPPALSTIKGWDLVRTGGGVPAKWSHSGIWDLGTLLWPGLVIFSSQTYALWASLAARM